jgi:isoleucyl-tRNA synthetase
MKRAEAADFPQFEEELLEVWDKAKTFQKSVDQRKGQKRFSFYDGPPFANGLPHYGHAVASTEKDAVTRYKTMRGFYAPRRAGWDTHGLPVEYEVEKQLGLSGKQQILDMGIAEFNQACRDSVFKYKHEWESFFRRFGRWIDTENAYATLDDSYIESVWWVLAQIYKKGLVYEDFRSNAYCPRCATPLSNFELNQGYQDGVEDPSVFVKFDLPGHDQPKSLLAWTTTPWTLPANAALAVAAEAEYVEVELLDDGDSWQRGERLILAKERLSVLELRKAEYKITNTVTGRQLVEEYQPSYEPLYHLGGTEGKASEAAWRVYLDESVSLEDGTGILHVAPRYGETDLALGKRVNLPLIESVDGNGRMVAAFKDVEGLEEVAGLFFKDADRHIIADLGQKGRLFAAETFTHTYPFCWRCDTPLLYFALPTWYIKVSSVREELVANNQKINWVPGHMKEGRFGNWLAEARDWNFSRNRFWGAPLPLWRCADNHITVVESLAELKEKASNLPADLDLHRPGIDAVTLKCNDCGKEAQRVEEVFDCWFESGSMPYAEDHYPFENKADFEERFPAEFIAEGQDQTRGWFYTLHVLATLLFDQPSFKNVVVNGLVLAADGKKLSKRLRNYPEPQEIFSKYGADSLRFFFCASPVMSAEDVRFSDDAVGDVYRNVFMTLWNVFSFLTTYAVVDDWQPGKTLDRPESENVLDRWLLARLDEATAEATRAADAYQIARAVRPLRELIEDLSNWYVRRSRRRFKSEDEEDKQAAYATLHYAMVRVSQLLAPWSPFLADKLWLGLTEGMDLPESVHLSDWPQVDPTSIDADLLVQMREARQVVTDGLAVRSSAGIKVRQPLAKLTYGGEKITPELEQIVAEEVNVKVVEHGKELHLETELTAELRQEGIMRDLVRLVQDARKQAGLQPGDRIRLGLWAESEDVQKAIKHYHKALAAETLADELIEAADGTVGKVNGEPVRISVEKL